MDVREDIFLKVMARLSKKDKQKQGKKKGVMGTLHPLGNLQGQRQGDKKPKGRGLHYVPFNFVAL